MVGDDFYHNAIQLDMLIFPEPEGDLSSCKDFLSVHEVVAVIPDVEFLTTKMPHILMYFHDDDDMDLAITRKWRMYIFSERQIQMLRKRADRLNPQQRLDPQSASSAFFSVFRDMPKSKKIKPFNIRGKLNGRQYCLQIPGDRINDLLNLMERGIEDFKTLKKVYLKDPENETSVPAVSA